MRVAVDGLSASVVGPTLYVVGGVDGLLQAYDSVRDRWTLKAAMPTACRDLATGVVDGLIYAVGGRGDPWGVTDVVEVYDPRTDTWQKRVPPAARARVSGRRYGRGKALRCRWAERRRDLLIPRGVRSNDEHLAVKGGHA